MVENEDIMAILRRFSGPAAFEEIMAAAGGAKKAVRRRLDEMLRGGNLIETRAGLYLPVDRELVTGYFEAHRDGYGFLVPEKPGQRDIFIPPDLTLSAMDGDRVVAKREGERRAPYRRGAGLAHREAGRIIRIIERAHKRVAGTLHSERTGSYLVPRHRRLPVILIAPVDTAGARKGQSVIVDIKEYPSVRRPPSGRIIKILGRPAGPRAEVEAIKGEFGLPGKFPNDARKEARRLLTAKGFGRRADLTGLRAVTIDGERARDFDDAVSVELDDRGYGLRVHIADVGFYVGWDTPLDLEARKRGTSVYFPDGVVPMLPPELSEDLCSLKPGVERAALTVEMRFDRYGERLDVKLYPALVKSHERMTYTSVGKILLDGDPAERKRHEHLLPDIELMAELCGILRQRRLARGSLDFDLPEPEIILDMRGRPEAIIRSERNLAHMMIEEFMIAANEAVAEHLAALGVPLIYRIHEEPDPERLEGIAKFAAPPPGLRPRKLILETLRTVRGRPEEEPAAYAVLRSMKQARYSPENAGHFGLASGCYTHFTSPIRRYPDLVVHRILRETLLKKSLPGKRLRQLEALLPDIAYHSSRMERVADAAEKEATDAMRVWFMKDRVGDEFEGKIMDVTHYGLRVRLDEAFVEGFLHVSYMADDYYVYDEGGPAAPSRRGQSKFKKGPSGFQRGLSAMRAPALRGKNTGKTFRLGQKITVRVDRVDMEEREIIFGT